MRWSGLAASPMALRKSASLRAVSWAWPGVDPVIPVFELMATTLAQIRGGSVTSCEAFFNGAAFFSVVGASCAGRSRHRLNRHSGASQTGRGSAKTGRQPPSPAPRPATPACRFDRFLAELKAQAVAAGVSQRALAEAAPYLVYDQGIVNRDRGQRVFGQVFTEFAGRMAATYRMQQGQAKIKTYAAAFARAEKEYGVPPAVIAAFWGLESDFGANMGNLPTLRSLVSLAYDCRRSEMFQNETIAALKIIDRGDLSPDRDDRLMGRRTRPDAISADALFQLRRRLRRRRPSRSPAQPGRRDRLDRELHRQRIEMAARRTLAAGSPRAAKFASVPWDQADLTIQLPRSKWAQLGVTYPDGKALPGDNLPASLLLPMGRMGPAFLAYANFAAYTEWNNSLIYSTTAGYLASRIAGSPPMHRPVAPVVQLPFNETARAAATTGARGLQCRQGRRRDGPAKPQLQ